MKLEAGGLFVYAPVAPTRECLALVRELEEEHGEVSTIVLPTVAVEHKVFAGVFSRSFPKASVWVAPAQYSFPINLPLEFLGFPLDGRTRILPASSKECRGTPDAPPWLAEFEHEILGPLDDAKGNGAFVETAFFHKTTGTLLVVDTIVKVPDSPPAIVEDDTRALLYHARDNFRQVVTDTPEIRRKGWKRISLFALFFQPPFLDVVEVPQCFLDAAETPEPMKKLGWAGLYPFEWDNQAVERSFQALRSGTGLLVAPILQVLILNRQPETVIRWADRVSAWKFSRIIPCHFSSPIEAGPAEFRSAFNFLEDVAVDISPIVGTQGARPLAEDFQALLDAEAGLVKSGSIFDRPKKVRRLF